MTDRAPTPSEQRMAKLCAIRRPLKDREITEALRLRRAIYCADWKRERYANDPAYREKIKARVAEYKARRRGQRV